MLGTLCTLITVALIEELKTDKATLVCLAQMPVWFADVSWTSNGSPVTGGVFTSAAEQKPDKTFGLSSFLTIKSSEWISDRVFNCKLVLQPLLSSHSNLLVSQLDIPSYCTQTELRFLYGGVHHLYHCGIRPRNEADCHCEELKTDKVTLVCLAQMPVWFADVSWTSNGSPVTGGVFTSAAEQKPDKTFGLSSFLTIKSSEWISDRVFTCKVSVGSTKSEKSLKKSDCTGQSGPFTPHTDNMLGTLCTLITVLSCVNGVTVVTQKPPVLTVSKGDTATMDCSLGTVTDYPAYWYKQVPGLAHSAASSTSEKGLSPHDTGVSRPTIVMSPTPSAVGNKGSA
ncbi:hypothetical protein SKAU_G00301610 [Synaphobranchus kaupii]|uniref:Ig-like domain-containing protein n=1 Tax=Synaphobranchus kaupii TaxID=118154 RepID=A0A9Q1EVS9_SYNKA|nr:hypothetical protein SKAU_G00301610 [Synaphobranchus kaupii]